MNILLIVIIGLCGGLASGLFGIGGAIIMVPLLTMFLDVPQKLAQGTTLLMFMVAPSFLAGLQYYKSGNADIKTAGLLWIGVFLGSAFGAWLLNDLFKDSVLFSLLLKRCFSVMLLLLAIKVWISA